MPLLFSLLAFILASLLAAAAVFAQTNPFGGGDGTEGTPYQISTIAHLNAIRDNSGSSGENYLDDHYILMNDLDFTGHTYADASKGWLPIGHDTDKDPDGFQGTKFTGTFDGGGNVIRSLKVSRADEDYVGVFGAVGSGGSLKNLGVEGRNISGNTVVGGIVGNNTGTITSCYSTGSVMGKNNVGGLVGQNTQNITSCYATGTVTGRVGSLLVGGFVGNNSGGTVSTSYWDKGTSGTDTSAGGTGETTADMKALTTGAFGANDSDWDFGNDTQYPALKRDETVVGGQPCPRAGCYFGGGRGTAEDPYQISSIEHLNAIRGDFLDDHFVLTKDLDFGDTDGNGADYVYSTASDAENAKGWLPIAHDTDSSATDFQGTQFAGTFDGGGHVILNLSISRAGEDYMGVFGFLVSGGAVKNLSVKGQDISGDTNVGGIVGASGGMIISCYSTGAVTGNMNVGGLVGFNGGTTTSCYATGTVTGRAGSSSVGGVVGRNFRDITYCYATGTVTSGTESSLVGGLAGSNGGERRITQSFWDIDTSGIPVATSRHGTGKTTAEMKALTGDAASTNWGTDEWDFGDSTQYPALKRGDSVVAGQPCPRVECGPLVSIAAGTSPVTEGTDAEFTLTRTGDTTAALTVMVVVTGGDSFLSGTAPTEAVFDAGNATATITATTADDEVDEADGTVTATITADASKFRLGDAAADVAVEDDDLPLVSIAKTADATEGVSGMAASAVFTVSRGVAGTDPLDVKVGLAFSEDFSSSAGSEGMVTIVASETSATLEVGVTDNDMDQADGTITATLVEVDPATYDISTTAGEAEAEATISDDDLPSIISFEVGGSSGRIDEDADPKTITVTVAEGTSLVGLMPEVVTVRSDATFAPSVAVTFVDATAQPYTVTAGGDTVTYQVTVNVVVGTPPGVPVGFSAVAGVEQVTLSWTAPTELGSTGTLTRYEYRQTQGVDVSPWTAVEPATALTQVVGSLMVGVVYGFEVRAVGSNELAGDATAKEEATAVGALMFTGAIEDQTYPENTAITALELPVATGGMGMLTYTLTPVPTGLSFDAASRTLTGTPTTTTTTTTTHTYTVTTTSGTALTTSLTFMITVSVAPPTLSFGSETIANQTYAVSTVIPALALPVATGGTGPYTYTLTPVPMGLSFDATSRMLTGTPGAIQMATAHTYTVTDDTAGTTLTVTLTFTITVNAEGTPTFMGTVEDQTYTQNTAITDLVLPVATGGVGALTYTLTPVPAGLMFDATTRTLSGMPTATTDTATTHTYTVTDSTTDTALTVTLTFTITVNAEGTALTFSGTIANQTYTQNTAITDLVLPEATGGMGSYMYTLTPVPAGLMFDATTRTLSGMPTATTDTATTHTYTVTDSTTDTALTKTLTFTITVNEEGSPTFADTIANQTYTKDTAITSLELPVATGGMGTLTYTLTPVPDGLEFDATTRTLSGTPTAVTDTATTHTYTVTDSTPVTALTASPDVHDHRERRGGTNLRYRQPGGSSARVSQSGGRCAPHRISGCG